MICSSCRLCADHAEPHLCVTSGDEPGWITLAGLRLAHPDGWATLLAELQAHPASVVDWQRDLPEGLWRPVLLPVDATWCTCACQAPSEAR